MQKKKHCFWVFTLGFTNIFLEITQSANCRVCYFSLRKSNQNCPLCEKSPLRSHFSRGVVPPLYQQQSLVDSVFTISRNFVTVRSTAPQCAGCSRHKTNFSCRPTNRQRNIFQDKQMQVIENLNFKIQNQSIRYNSIF